MGRLKRALKVIGLVLVVVLVIVGALIGNLLTSNPYPRPEAEGWARLRDMPGARGEVGSTVVFPGPTGTQDICPQGPCAPQFVVAGGLSGPTGKTVARVDIFDAGRGTWRAGPALPAARHHPAAAAIDGAVYVAGGARKATDWAPERNLWILRPGAESWDRLPDLPEGRMGHAMVAAAGKLYVVGGRGRTSRVLIYDRTTGWSEGAEMPGRRDHLAAVVVQGKILAIGGREDRILRRVDVYDIGSNTWTAGTDLPRATSGMAAELLGDGRVHVVGGEDPGTLGGGVVDIHFVLDLSTNTWSAGPEPLLPVHGAASDEVAGVMLVAGGARRQGAFSVLSWTGVTQRFDPRQAPIIPSPTPTSPSPAPSPTPTPSPASPSPTSPPSTPGG